ncbi:UNVERIFIED_CONTAM: E3 ubiquitin-protein ligase COP1 [Sesamum radiatum]|uniref:E3 ubiquitin-protein ligase COP1 n=1 Tax=Sesamum radiatum TaxID=300843 RepID=A0AAW2K2U1_SESRA
MGGQTTSIAGALVPTVKSEPADSSAEAPPEKVQDVEEVDKDILCPICMQIIKDAFLTVCGHSFCYMCIVTHLQNKSDCPCCSHFLTANHIYPNFLLNKVRFRCFFSHYKRFTVFIVLSMLSDDEYIQVSLTVTDEDISSSNSKNWHSLEQLRQALEQGCEASVKELESLLYLIAEKKSKMEREEAETNLQILLDFLHCLKKKKLDELSEIDCGETPNRVVCRRRDRLRKTENAYRRSPSKLALPLLMDKHCGLSVSRTAMAPGQGRMSSGGSQNRKVDGKSSTSPLILRKDSYGGSDTQSLTHSGLALARKRRVHAQFNDLQDCYLQKRRYWARLSSEKQERDRQGSSLEGYSEGLEDFQSVLSTFTRYSRLRVVAELRHGDLFHSANIVSSNRLKEVGYISRDRNLCSVYGVLLSIHPNRMVIEFDRDDELFATAGVSRRIKIFEFSSVVNEPSDVQCPVAEMSTRSKLSCLSWNKYAKNHIASSDYEGIVTVWDVTTRQSVMEYEEHEKRAWSVDFSRTEPSMLVSGSDDCKVKVWCTKQEASVLNIDMKANICSVKYNPGSSIHIAVGSADHHIHYYDLRKISQPLHIFSGHRKAVSYVKFLSNNELASASTDSTLRLWDVNENVPLRVFRGHANEKNFVGLTVNSEYIACGSETNEVFVYHKAISRPAAWHRFVSTDTDEADEDAGSYFISAVCWKSDSPTMLTANSQGTIKVLVLAP